MISSPCLADSTFCTPPAKEFLPSFPAVAALRSSTELELLASAVGPVATRPVPEADAADRGEDDEAGEIERRLG